MNRHLYSEIVLDQVESGTRPLDLAADGLGQLLHTPFSKTRPAGTSPTANVYYKPLSMEPV